MLERLDIFGTPISIRFNNFHLHKTIYGSFITAAVFVLIIVYSYSIVIQCLSYQRPNVVYQENIVEQPSEYSIELNKSTFAMGIQDKDLVHFIDETIYYLDVQLLETRKILNEATNEYQQSTSKISIKMEPCTLQHFQVKGTQVYFQKLKYQNLYCFPLDSQITFEGQFGAMVYRRLYVQVKTCEINCSDTTIIEQKLSNVAFQLYYVNYAVKSTDKEIPFQPIVQNTFWQSGISLFKNINVYFRKTTVTSDFGLFLENFVHEDRLIYSFDRETIITKADNKMYEIYIGLEKNKETEYIRTYLKLYSGISQIGGIFNILFILGCIVSIPISRVSLEQKLINQIFNFQKKREESKCQIQMRIDQNVSSRQTLGQQLFSTTTQPKLTQQDWNNLDIEYNISSPLENAQKRKKTNIPYVHRNEIKKKHQLDSVENINLTTNQLYLSSQNDKFQLNNTHFTGVLNTNGNNYQPSQQSNPAQVEYVIGIKRIREVFSNAITATYNKITIPFFTLLKSKLQKSLKNQRPYSKMINYGVEKLYSQLDISYIMNKLIEIEKLKHLLLNENQIKLFEFIPKPTIYLQDFEDELKQRKSQQNNNPELQSNLQEKPTSPQLLPIIRQPKFSLLKDEVKDEIQKSKEAEEAFNQIFKIEKSQSKIDKRLIQLLDMDVIQEFELNSQCKIMNTNPQLPQQTQFGDTVVNMLSNNSNNNRDTNPTSFMKTNNFELQYAKQRYSDTNELKPELESSPQKYRQRIFSSIPNNINLQTNDDNT